MITFSANDFSNIKLLCLGDVMLDRFIYGKIERISPEAPVPILHYKQENIMLGGAGNVIRNIVSLGGKAHFITAIGKDLAGSLIEQYLNDDNNNVTSDLVLTHHFTTEKTRFIAQNHHLLRLDREEQLILSREEEENITQKIDNIFEKNQDFQAIILSDYQKGFCTPSVCQHLINRAKQYDIPVIVDPKGLNWSKYQGADWIKPNLKEMISYTSLNLDSIDSIVKACQIIQNRYNIRHVLVTLGERGMVYVGPREKVSDSSDIPYFYHIPTHTKEIFDVSGAGDTVASTLGLKIGYERQRLDFKKGNDITQKQYIDACFLANKAASIVITKVGTATISAIELEQSMSNFSTNHQKILSKDQLSEIVQKWRHQGLKVGFTNGCFDLLHQGHLQLLHESKAACNRLIVALNTDQSVQLNKGPQRPIQDEQTRCHVIANLHMVDAVVLFGEQTPLKLIEKLLPDVLIKGDHYQENDIIGGDIVMKKGGKILRVPIIKGHSTSCTVAKIKK
jgi:D-beta-D-heptose 7-phosphate kinase/D-beta-D-heptose 1-phosphate adenosyltransferase